MAFYPCSNSVPTQTYSVSRNGTYDMGQTHKYRYVSVNVLPAGGLSKLYYNEFVADHVDGTGGVGRETPSITFTAANNGLYYIVFRYVGSSERSDWPNRGSIAFGGSARYWTNIVDEHTNCARYPRYVVYNSQAVAYVIGNGSNVSVTWNVQYNTFMTVSLYQINW